MLLKSEAEERWGHVLEERPILRFRRDLTSKIGGNREGNPSMIKGRDGNLITEKRFQVSP